MDKILHLIDDREFEQAEHLAEIQIKSSKSEQEKALFRSLRAHALCELGKFGMARQIIDPAIYTQLAAISEVDKRTLGMLNFTYALNCDKAYEFLNFDKAKIEPLDKLYGSLESIETDRSCLLREELVIELSKCFIKLCKHKIEATDQLLEKAEQFFDFIVCEMGNDEELKNQCNTGCLGSRIHRENGLGYVNFVFQYLAALLCNSSTNAEMIIEFISRNLEKSQLASTLRILNPRLFILLNAYLADEECYNVAIYKELCSCFLQTRDKSYVQPIIDFSTTSEMPDFILADKSFDCQYIKWVQKLSLDGNCKCDLLHYCHTIEDFELTYELFRKNSPEIELRGDLSDLLFGKFSKQQILAKLSEVDDKGSEMDALMLSGIIIQTGFEVAEIKPFVNQLASLISRIEANYYHNAYYLKILLYNIEGQNSSCLLSEFSQRTLSSYNLYITSMPAVFPSFFAEQFEPEHLVAKDVFRPIELINHTDEKTIWNFPQIMMGTVLYGSMNRVDLCRNVHDSVCGAGNPYIAARLLEARHFVTRSYERLFADALLSAYNVAFTVPELLKDKGNLLFEGVCGNELTTSPAAAEAVFGDNYDLLCEKSLYFATESFFSDRVENFPKIKEIETKTEFKTVTPYELFLYDTEFADSFKKLLQPTPVFHSETPFGLLACFCAAVMRLLFCVMTNKSEPLEEYCAAFLDMEIPFIDNDIKSIFVKGLLFEKLVLKQKVEQDVQELSGKSRNCDVYIGGALAMAVVKVADLKKVDVKFEKEAFRKMFGNVLQL